MVYKETTNTFFYNTFNQNSLFFPFQNRFKSQEFGMPNKMLLNMPS